jgi:hypothetical protein
MLTSVFVFESQGSGKDVLAAFLVIVFVLMLSSQALTLKNWYSVHNKSKPSSVEHNPIPSEPHVDLIQKQKQRSIEM